MSSLWDSVTSTVGGLFGGGGGDNFYNAIDNSLNGGGLFEELYSPTSSGSSSFLGSLFGGGGTSGSGGSSFLGNALLGGGQVVGGMLASQGARDAASIQAGASGDAAQAQLNMFNTVRQLMAPYVGLGYGATQPLAQLTGTVEGGNPLTAPLTRPFSPGDLTQTPGYQFQLDQGLRGTQQALTATGLGRSGNAVKAAADYNQGLAGQTYNTQLGNYLAQNQQIYNMLGGLVQSGQGAAQGVGSGGIQSQTQANALTTGGAGAMAQGALGSANALANSAANAGLLLGGRV